MAETADLQIETPKKSIKLPLLLGLLLAVLGGGGAFYATFSGMILAPAKMLEGGRPEKLPDIAFVPIEPVVISLGQRGKSQYLRFSAQLEVDKALQAEATLILPRVQDVLNSYLRAVDVSVLENPEAMVRLRAQMLRRVQMVAGEGRIRDLLITEFVLN